MVRKSQEKLNDKEHPILSALGRFDQEKQPEGLTVVLLNETHTPRMNTRTHTLALTHSVTPSVDRRDDGGDSGTSGTKLQNPT